MNPDLAYLSFRDIKTLRMDGNPYYIYICQIAADYHKQTTQSNRHAAVTIGHHGTLSLAYTKQTYIKI